MKNISGIRFISWVLLLFMGEFKQTTQNSHRILSHRDALQGLEDKLMVP
jgi:hypothetical protein